MSTSVGVISLDLVIKDKINEQLEKIKAQVSAPAAKVGDAINEAIVKPMAKVGENIKKTVSEATEKANDALKEIKAPDVTVNYENNAEKIINANKEILDLIGEIPDEYELIKQKVDSLYEKLEILKEKETELTEIVDGGVGGIAKTEAEWDKAYEALKRVKEQQNSIYIQLGTISKRAQKEIESGFKAPIQEVVEDACEKLEKLGNFKVKNKAIPRLKQEIELAVTQMSILQKKWQELSSASGDGNSEKLVKTEQQIISTQKKIEGLKAKLKELNRVKLTPLRFAFSALAKTAKLTANITGKFLNGTFKSVKFVGVKALSAVGKGFKSIAKSALSTAKPVSKLGTVLKNTFKRVFLMAGIYAAFRAIKDGFLATAKANEEFSNSLNQVKANLAIAFTPIMQAIMPALNTMMAGLANVTKQIAGFISGLFGKTYQQAAEATKKLKSTTDAAKKAKLAMAGIDEMNVLSADSGGSDEKDSGGIDYSKIDMSEPELPDWAERLKESIKSGDWAGVGKILAERVNAVFSSIDWDKISDKLNSGIRAFTSAFNGFVDNLNWGLIGDKIAGGINTISSAVLTFFNGINWESLGSNVAEGLNHIIDETDWKQLGAALVAKFNAVIDGLNGFVKKFNFKKLGKSLSTMLNSAFKSAKIEKAGETLGKSIQGIFDTAHEFFTGFDFRGLGETVGRSVNAVINNIDFGMAAKTLSEGVAGIFNTLSGFIQTVDWSGLGKKIIEFIKGIDFGAIAKSFFELFGSALGGAVSLLSGVIGTVVKDIKKYFSDKIKDAGGNVAKGLLNGILDGLKNIGTWIVNHVFKPFIDGFKKAFGIHSPSKVMAEMGGYIIDGLYNAVSSGITKIREIFTKMLNTIKEIFSPIVNWFKDKFSQAWEAIKSIFSGIGNWFSERWNDITVAFSSVGNWFSDKFTTAWNNIKSAFSSVGTFFQGVWDGITSVFSHITDWFRDKFSEAWAAIKAVFTAGGVIFEGIAESIAEIFKDVVNSLIDGINWVIAQPINAINAALDGIRDWGVDFGLGEAKPFSWLPEIGVPEIPHLANGGLATAPTLAMVGDNRNAGVDPEVIAPLSKLQGMLGGENSEIVELLRLIVELLKSGMNIEIINYMFRNSREFSREVLNVINNDNARRGI